ncbi:hypothetical protein C0991_003699 [Blastosporella zonata]|nr:hypothetical protein C0991_003699 [Blastosporella zonata]
MDSIPDLAKKTSINSLLNPEDGYTQASINHLSGALAHTPTNDVYAASYASGPSFNLRAASWGGNDDRSKLDSGRHYQTAAHQHQSIDIYNGGRVGREREENGYAMAPMWLGTTAHQYGTAAPTIAPMYSDERTALSGDYTHTNYTGQPYSNSDPQWQVSERASSRIAARSSNVDSTRYASGYYQPYPTYPDSHSHSQPSQPQLPRVVQPPPKRRSPEEDTEPPPKAKRTKVAPAPVTKTPSTSKRGYPAKKRNEAAQIASQNAKLQLSFTAKQPEKGKEKAASSGVSMEIVPLGPNDQGQPLHAEAQSTRCMSTKYKNDPFPRCVACTRRWAGDTCRFQGIRYFLRDSNMNIVGVTFSETQKADLPSMKFPTQWNEKLTAKHIHRTKATIARALLPTLRKELVHLRIKTIVHRPRERDVRATCDTCMTSIFSTSWLCRLCGREACADCYATVVDLTSESQGMDEREVKALQARREKHQFANPFFLQCTKRVEHKAHDFSPMSRFCETELDTAIKEMDAMLLLEGPQESTSTSSSSSGLQQTQHPSQQYGWKNNMQHQQHQYQHQPGPSRREPYMSYSVPAPPIYSPSIPPTITTPLFFPANLSPTTISTPSHPLRRFNSADLTPDTFPALWALGEPLVVQGLLPAFSITWTPEYFIEKYGLQSCLVIECQTEVNRRVTVGEFFKQFGKYEERGADGGKGEVWKLKDWPPSMDFKKAFPELWEDFGNAVPVPSYVRRDGVMNLASHFPEDTVAPDIGPKMYNSLATTTGEGSKGSTRLHMDMADAINIMTYASLAPDGSPGCAAWDLFRPEDSDKLREYLAEYARTHKDLKGNKEQTKGATAAAAIDWRTNDPIHGQQFYLDEEMRASLYENTGVKSYRFYQRPGDAVFIPAGCAHQVANLADCIKVAVDFVSPENVERCERLTKEFREQNSRKMWKEDVLQLRTMMWFAWLSCRAQETQDDSEEED